MSTKSWQFIGQFEAIRPTKHSGAMNPVSKQSLEVTEAAVETI